VASEAVHRDRLAARRVEPFPLACPLLSEIRAAGLRMVNSVSVSPRALRLSLGNRRAIPVFHLQKKKSIATKLLTMIFLSLSHVVIVRSKKLRESAWRRFQEKTGGELSKRQCALNLSRVLIRRLKREQYSMIAGSR
jgi:hypothetical protein